MTGANKFQRRLSQVIRTSIRLGIAAAACLTVTVWAGSTLSAGADEAAAKAECTVIDRNESTVVMVCPKAVELLTAGERGLLQLRTAGEQACIDTTPCLVWIWENAENAPEKAPRLSDGLTQEQVQSAAAVWVNDSKEMLTISAQRKSE